jgi:acetamidase/formamidase
VIHDVPLERRVLHGSFSRDYEPVLTIDPGDTVMLSCPDVSWRLLPGPSDGPPPPGPWERDPVRDVGHCLTGPFEIRGAEAGHTLEVRIDEVRVGRYGFTVSGGDDTWLNRELGLLDCEPARIIWELDPDARVGRGGGHELDLAPFPGVLGMPPAEPGVHPTPPPRPCGGNIDCNLLQEGATLWLPIAVDGALFSAGDGHARQGDGELGQAAIECPLERLQLTLDVRDDFPLDWPVAWTPEQWITFGFDEDLNRAVVIAVEGMLELMGRELGLARTEALALSTAVVDLHVTQVVNWTKGVHATLRHDALRSA